MTRYDIMRLPCSFEKEAKLSHGFSYSLIYTPNVLDHLGSPLDLPQIIQYKVLVALSVKDTLSSPKDCTQEEHLAKTTAMQVRLLHGVACGI